MFLFDKLHYKLTQIKLQPISSAIQAYML